MRPIRLMCLAGFLLASAASASAMRNPAAVYCESLGYKYVVETSKAGEVGYCMIGNEKVDAWRFLRGEVAADRTYCAKKGYSQKIVKDVRTCKRFMTESCLVCITEGGKEVEVTTLMGLSFSETTCGDGVCGFPENHKTCPQDCPSGGADGYCDAVKDGKCDPDCKAGEDPDCGEKKTDKLSEAKVPLPACSTPSATPSR